MTKPAVSVKTQAGRSWNLSPIVKQVARVVGYLLASLARTNWKFGDAICTPRKKMGWHILDEMCTTADGRKTKRYWLSDEHLELAKRKLETTK